MGYYYHCCRKISFNILAISNTVIYTAQCVHYTIFSVVKLDIFRLALLLDDIFAAKKTKCMLGVHLV